jgi:DNA-binding Lrp family transcriptional regulator
VKANLDNPQADFDFSRIYRSTQDADLVVDGTAEDAERLEAKIKEKMSYLQGVKDSFEVGLLQCRLSVSHQA